MHPEQERSDFFGEKQEAHTVNVYSLSLARLRDCADSVADAYTALSAHEESFGRSQSDGI